jgi:hypothetical protein
MATDKEAMRQFRATRKLLGFANTSVYVPRNRMAEHSRFLERLKAERLLEVLETYPSGSPEIAALAGRNYSDIPDRQFVQGVKERFKQHRAVTQLCNELLASIERAALAHSMSKREDQDDLVKWQAEAVAYSALASVQSKELNALIFNLERPNGRTATG